MVRRLWILIDCVVADVVTSALENWPHNHHQTKDTNGCQKRIINVSLNLNFFNEVAVYQSEKCDITWFPELGNWICGAWSNSTAGRVNTLWNLFCRWVSVESQTIPNGLKFWRILLNSILFATVWSFFQNFFWKKNSFQKIIPTIETVGLFLLQ